MSARPASGSPRSFDSEKVAPLRQKSNRIIAQYGHFVLETCDVHTDVRDRPGERLGGHGPGYGRARGGGGVARLPKAMGLRQSHTLSGMATRSPDFLSDASSEPRFAR
eukprot:7111230-Alexandrium_andersonii.AAC.1